MPGRGAVKNKALLIIFNNYYNIFFFLDREYLINIGVAKVFIFIFENITRPTMTVRCV